MVQITIKDTEYIQYLKMLDEFYIKKKEQILITRHSKCVTLGRNSDMTEILQQNVPVYFSNRGGGATYHDLGQLIVYPFINLKNRKLNIRQFIETLQNWLIEALQLCEIEVFKKDSPGLWRKSDKTCEHEKIGFIGLTVKNGFVGHGIAINLYDCEVENFKNIIPCREKITIGKCKTNFEKLSNAIIKNNPWNFHEI